MRTLEILYAARVPTILWGPPGTGKTSAIERMAERLGARLFVPHVRAPEDIAVPVARGGHVEVVPVAEFAEAAQWSGPAIVFLDEMTTLAPSTQASALRFLDTGRVGSYRLGPHVWRSAAANPPDCAAGGYELEPPTANRLAHVDWIMAAEEWCSRFASLSWDGDRESRGLVEWGSDEWLEWWARARALVVAFIHAQPHMYFAMPSESSARGRAWPSPRTWDYASRALAAVRCDVVEASDAIAACVGMAAAVQMVTWAREMALPSPEELLRDPALLRGLRRSDQQYAALVAVAAIMAGRQLTRDQWAAGWALAGVAADVCRDAAAGTVVRELCRALRDGRAPAIDRMPPEFASYRALLEEARS